MKVRAPSKIFIFSSSGQEKGGREGWEEQKEEEGREFHPFRNCQRRLFVTSQLTERANAFSSFQMTSSSKMDLLASAARAPDNCRHHSMAIGNVTLLKYSRLPTLELSEHPASKCSEPLAVAFGEEGRGRARDVTLVGAVGTEGRGAPPDFYASSLVWPQPTRAAEGAKLIRIQLGKIDGQTVRGTEKIMRANVSKGAL